jgi:hypothetical protein
MTIAALAITASVASAATIGIEAEDFDAENSPGFDIESDIDASGGQFITTAGNTTSSPPDATVTYNITFSQDGDYDFYLRYRVLGGAFDDSFFAPDDFGVSPGWSSNNGLNTSGNWVWLNVSQAGNGGPYTVETGDLGSPLTFKLGGREDGFDIDGFVLSTDGNLSDEQLDTAIPEPASLALFGLGGMLILARRRAA